MRGKVIAVVGARSRDTEADFLLTESCFLSIYQPGDRVVSGGCPQGGDRFAEILAARYGAELTVHRPSVKGEGRGAFRRAAFSRNTKIANDATHLIACMRGREGGTWDTVEKFIRREADCRGISFDEAEAWLFRERGLIYVPQAPDFME